MITGQLHCPPERLLQVCGHLFGGIDAPGGLPGEWVLLSGPAARHGLLPLLFWHATARGTLRVPEGVLACWQREYAPQAQYSRRNRGHLRELITTLEREGAAPLPLKGTGCILTLYGVSNARPVRDLDILIRADRLEATWQSLVRLGYKPNSNWSSHAFDSVQWQGECPSFNREGSITVELHAGLEIPQADLEEVWSRAITIVDEGVPIQVLCPAHFLIHTALHYMKHLEFNFAPLKGLVDMALAIRKYEAELDWADFWDTAERWGAREKVAVVMASLNHHWGLGVPGVPEGVEPLSAQEMVYGGEDTAEKRAAHLPGVYAERLRRVRQLPGAGARCRYLFRLVVPEPENMRLRYGVPEGRSLLVPYLRHPFTLAGRLLNGLAVRARRGVRKP